MNKKKRIVSSILVTAAISVTFIGITLLGLLPFMSKYIDNLNLLFPAYIFPLICAVLILVIFIITYFLVGLRKDYSSQIEMDVKNTRLEITKEYLSNIDIISWEQIHDSLEQRKKILIDELKTKYGRKSSSYAKLIEASVDSNWKEIESLLKAHKNTVNAGAQDGSKVDDVDEVIEEISGVDDPVSSDDEPELLELEEENDTMTDTEPVFYNSFSDDNELLEELEEPEYINPLEVIGELEEIGDFDETRNEADFDVVEQLEEVDENLEELEELEEPEEVDDVEEPEEVTEPSEVIEPEVVAEVPEEVIEEPETVEETETAEEVIEPEDVEEVTEEPELVEEIETTEEVIESVDPEEIEQTEPEEVAEAEEVEEVTEPEEIAEVDEIEEAEEIIELEEPAEPEEVIEEIEAFEEPEALEEVAEPEELAEPEEVEEIEELGDYDDDIEEIEEYEELEELDYRDPYPELLESLKNKPVYSADSNLTFISSLNDNFANVDNVFAEDLTIGSEYIHTISVTDTNFSFEPVKLEFIIDKKGIEELLPVDDDTGFSLTRFSENQQDSVELEPESVSTIVEVEGVYSIAEDLSYENVQQDQSFKALVNSVIGTIK